MEKEQAKICGTCQYHRYEDIDDDWVCVNADSEFCADWTSYTDSCDCWDGR